MATLGEGVYGVNVYGADAQDDRDAMLRLLPRGKAWPKFEGSYFHRLALGAGATFTAVRGRVVALLTELDPGQAFELIDDWEELLGLPDQCEQPTLLAERQRVARARLLAVLSPEESANASFYEGIAAELGYTATATKAAQPRFCGHYTCGDGPVRAGPWNYAILIETASGASDSLLECVMNRYSLLGTVAVVEYS